MPHTVYIDRTSHWEVLMDFSGSARHAALTEVQWQSEYTTDAAYASMRTSFPTAVAGITPKGVGKWLKDWSAAYVDPYVQLKILSNATADFDGVPAVVANGVAKHILTIKKVDQNGADVVLGAESLQITASAGVPISKTNPSLVNGSVTVEVGPVGNACDVILSASDPAQVLRPGQLKIRFKNSPFAMLPKNDSFIGNGTTTVFTLTATPYPGSLQVYKGGMLQAEGAGKDFVLSGTTITFAIAPANGIVVTALYIS